MPRKMMDDDRARAAHVERLSDEKHGAGTWLIAETDLAGSVMAYYVGHVDLPGREDDGQPVWSGDRSEAYPFQTERYARQIAEQFQDYAAARSYGTRYSVERV